MLIQKDFSLTNYNTFGIAAVADRFVAVTSTEQLEGLLAAAENQKIIVLGGGSNVLLPDHFPGLVLFNNIKFIRIAEMSAQLVQLEIGGGVNWHELVIWSLRQGYGGLENMALIPGTVGAAPIQNIGAYGRELQDVFVSLEAYELGTGRMIGFDRTDCSFGYRHSIFKTPEHRNRYLITSVRLQLTRRDHELRTTYGAIQTHLTAKAITHPTPLDIAGAVIEIRRSKLPDWRQLGNAGSFFKNPVISQARFLAIQEAHPDLPSYPAGNDLVKLPAGWLIDQAGWKGQRTGSVGCYEKQALVLVNHGGATTREVVAFSQRIMADVEAKFRVKLEREVTVV